MTFHLSVLSRVAKSSVLLLAHLINPHFHCMFSLLYALSFPKQAPEIMQGLSYDAKVDLWSVGVILFGELC